MQRSPFLLVLVGQCSLLTCQLYEYHFNEEGKTWDEAQSFCREKYTDLATVTNMTDATRLLGSRENPAEAWIGLYSDPETCNKTWHWSLPGVEFHDNETQWNSGEPNNKDNEENCGFMRRNLRWGDISCLKSSDFICYNDRVVLINESKTWEEALVYCREKHYDLVTITNLDEQRWVQDRAKKANSPYVWLGLRYTCTLQFWFWVSDVAVTYKNWDSHGETDDCDMSGAMDRGGEHKWIKKLDNENFNFICSKFKPTPHSKI
ncbi:E-selectin-like [Xiphias gladius]|uniref:E-selectin-like n=1 Tax=Xiphias gladius TaxID=8245 RepID=UPI001A9A0C95|nr:E-selectin-like [Xiphias gladius]